MSLCTTINGVAIQGISAAVPETIAKNHDLENIYGSAIQKVIAITGVEERRIAKELCTSDLCFAAATALLEDMKVAPDSIDAVVFLSQSPDHAMPATSCLLQERLGVSESCACFDMSLGCSGYVYGLWAASSLLAANDMQNVLLLVGDTTSRMTSPDDRSVALLFGDAGSATLLTKDHRAPAMSFALGSDGAGGKNLIVPAGGFRMPLTAANQQRTERAPGVLRSDADLAMNGSEIFTFSMTHVPKLIKSVLEKAEFDIDDIDDFVFHQASKVILDHLRKRMRLPAEKVVNSVRQFGNTSSASVPLGIVAKLADKLQNQPTKLVLAAFGVGYSWAAVTLETNNVTIPNIIVVPESAAASAPT